MGEVGPAQCAGFGIANNNAARGYAQAANLALTSLDKILGGLSGSAPLG